MDTIVKKRLIIIIIRLHLSGIKQSEIIKQFKIHQSTVSRILKRIYENLNFKSPAIFLKYKITDKKIIEKQFISYNQLNFEAQRLYKIIYVHETTHH